MTANVPELLRQGYSYHQAGQLPQAEALYRQALAIEPRNADALNLFGLLAYGVGRYDAALKLLGAAMEAQPFVGHYYNSYGECLRRLGRWEEAISIFQQGLARDPRMTEAWSNMGLALDAMGRIPEGEAAYRKALAITPTFAEAITNLAVNLNTQKRYEDSLQMHQAAIRTDPNYAIGWNNYGVTLENVGQLEEAIAAYLRATQLNPRQAESYHNAGVPLIKLNRAQEAKDNWRKAIALRPDYADPHFNLGLALLLEGDMEQGWAEHEWRWKVSTLAPSRGFSQPQWDGSPLNGQTVLLHAEQGFGDTIQFIRFAPMVTARGGRVIVECQAEVLPLARSMTGVSEFVATGSPLPHFDLQIPFLSLGHAFKTTLTNVPADVPYLYVDDERRKIWRERVAGDRKFKIGLIWQGRPSHKDDKNRSMRLADLAPIAAIPGVSVYSLQKGLGVDQLADSPFAITDLTADLKDFADTGALAEALDLVIGVDTSVVHLAGALGRPVWTLLPFAPDWRWLMDRADTPWYPTMRLFRQKARLDWASVVGQVAAEIPPLVHASQESPRP